MADTPLYTDNVAVASAGTAVQLSSTSVQVTDLTLVASRMGVVNTNEVYIGGSDVDSSTGAALRPGASIGPLRGTYDLSEIYIDAETSTDGVQVFATRV